MPNCIIAQKEEADALCSTKTGSQCTLIFENKMFVYCQQVEESGSQTCKAKDIYSTCSSAKDILPAADSQCKQLSHSSNTYCVKGDMGCLEVAKCEDITGQRITDNICGNFPVASYQRCFAYNNTACQLATKACTDSIDENVEETCGKLTLSLENGKCYYNGAKCAEANSCDTVAETTLTGMALQVLCDQFSTGTKNCVADGKKCKFQELGEGGEPVLRGSSKSLNLSFAILFLTLII